MKHYSISKKNSPYFLAYVYLNYPQLFFGVKNQRKFAGILPFLHKPGRHHSTLVQLSFYYIVLSNKIKWVLILKTATLITMKKTSKHYT